MSAALGRAGAPDPDCGPGGQAHRYCHTHRHLYGAWQGGQPGCQVSVGVSAGAALAAYLLSCRGLAAHRLRPMGLP